MSGDKSSSQDCFLPASLGESSVCVWAHLILRVFHSVGYCGYPHFMGEETGTERPSKLQKVAQRGRVEAGPDWSLLTPARFPSSFLWLDAHREDGLSLGHFLN